MRIHPCLTAIAFILSGCVGILASAQTVATQSRAETRSIQAFRDSIKREAEEIALLQHLLEAATSERRILENSNVRAWIIGNPAVRDSLFYALIKADSSVESEAGAEAEVLATPHGDLIQVRFGTAVFKGSILRDVLEKSSDEFLYYKVAESYRYSKDIELRDPTSKLPTPVRPQLLSTGAIADAFSPMSLKTGQLLRKGKVVLSLYNLSFRSGSDWGGEIRLGNDEICFPFWSSGQASFLAIFRNVKFGITLPFIWGRTGFDAFPPLVLRGRTLNGTRGVTTEFDFGSIGGNLSATRMTNDDHANLTDPNNFYYINAIAQVYYSFAVNLDQRNYFRAKAGGGMHRVINARLIADPLSNDPLGSMEIKMVKNVVSPILKFEYVHRNATDKYTASFMYYNLTVMLTTGMELVPGLLSLEAKYVVTLAPDRGAWESPDLFVFTPRLTLSW